MKFEYKLMESGHVLLYDEYGQCHGQFDTVDAASAYDETVNQALVYAWYEATCAN